ncbi:MAG: alpha-L-fucosidase [Bacteroidales bacterium]|nr:alpha-L-fucosidase [Bacteroidales bacterium]
MKPTFHKIIISFAVILLGVIEALGQVEDGPSSSKIFYEANWDSLRQHEVPKWAEDAKFGIYAHWGVYSQTGEWDYKIANWGNYYITGYRGFYSTNTGHEQHQLFEKNLGKIEEGVGYKDLARKFTASNFDAKYWVDLIEKSGAKYAGMCAVHHDGYCMWDSEITDLCAGKTGPGRDLNGELFQELKKRGIKTIASFHHGRTIKHFSEIETKLLADPYYRNADLLNSDYYNYYWFMGGLERFTKNRKALTLEFIDKYSPDVLWFDGGGGKYDTEEILAHFFNNGIKNNKEVSVHNKGNFGKNFGVYSYENGAKRPSYVDWPWEDDTPSAVGWCDWQWDKNLEYKKSEDVIIRLVDLVSRNGGLLLSLNPRPDGTFDPEQEELLLGIGKWLKQNGEAIYGTRPWKIYGEGHLEDLFFTETNPVDGRVSRAIQPNTDYFNHEDVRFTTKNNILYATVLGISPDRKVLIKSLSKDIDISDQNIIEKIELIGHGEVKFTRDNEGLHINLPDTLPNYVALVFKLSVKGKLEQRENSGTNSVIPDQT